MKESEWTRKICAQMKMHGARVDAIVGGNTMQASGLPDRIICRERIWLVEFKGEKTKLTALQRAVHCECNRHGKNVFVARFPGELYFAEKLIGKFENGAELLQELFLFTNVPN